MPGSSARTQVRVGEEVLESERIFIDTGTRPDLPLLEGLGGIDFLDNASIMRLTEVPEHLLVLGGGYVGMEFGQMFRRFGSRVTVVQRDQQILPHEDADVAERSATSPGGRRHPFCPGCHDDPRREGARAESP